jgi:RNA polymerase sigma-70 factor, ECF subfamily
MFRLSRNSLEPLGPTVRNRAAVGRTMMFSNLGLGVDGAAADSSLDALTDRVARGESKAIGEVYDLHHAAVRAFARRLLGEPTAAEDLVHEVFVSLPKAMRNFQGHSSLRTFLISIAVNHSRHFMRSAARRRAAMDRFARERVAEPSEAPEAERYELALLLARALDQLPHDQRVAFVLCEVEERTSPEAAKIVGVPEATLRTRVFHAKRKLRTLLEQEGVR